MTNIYYSSRMMSLACGEMESNRMPDAANLSHSIPFLLIFVP